MQRHNVTWVLRALAYILLGCLIAQCTIDAAIKCKPANACVD